MVKLRLLHCGSTSHKGGPMEAALGQGAAGRPAAELCTAAPFHRPIGSDDGAAIQRVKGHRVAAATQLMVRWLLLAAGQLHSAAGAQRGKHAAVCRHVGDQLLVPQGVGGARLAGGGCAQRVLQAGARCCEQNGRWKRTEERGRRLGQLTATDATDAAMADSTLPCRCSNTDGSITLCLGFVIQRCSVLQLPPLTSWVSTFSSAASSVPCLASWAKDMVWSWENQSGGAKRP